MEQTDIRTAAEGYIASEREECFRAEVEALLAAGDWKELEDRFYRDLEFGTGGLRGLIGGGRNRMNTLVVARATQGLANYLKKTFPGKALSAAIAHDSRRHSDSFALATALVFAANGIKAHLFPSLRSTPELSFAVRRLGCDTGVVITASHNPPAYNGYKAYWNDGSQIVPPHDANVIAEVNAVKELRTMGKDEAVASGMLSIVGQDQDDAYVEMAKAQLFRPKLIRERASSAKIVYTPLHGAGVRPFERVMSELGLTVVTVGEQREPNGNFPTVSYPNPEEAAALRMAVELGAREKADVVMATDPDADRLGIAVPDGKGGFALLSGNQLGCLLMDYILLSREELGKMPEKALVVKSIVTTSLQDRIAAHYGARMEECLTGFKWIADIMRKADADPSRGTFVFGSEESYGFLVETEVRDKDGISAAAMTAEMAIYWGSKGKSLLDRLAELYAMHGYFAELAISKTFKGAEGMDTMRSIMAGHRKNQFETLGGMKVILIRDFSTLSEWAPGIPGRPIDYPATDAIQWYLEDGSWVTVRPSGTEPKIKYYACVQADARSGLEAAKESASAKIEAIKAQIRAVIGQ